MPEKTVRFPNVQRREPRPPLFSSDDELLSNIHQAMPEMKALVAEADKWEDNLIYRFWLSELEALTTFTSEHIHGLAEAEKFLAALADDEPRPSGPTWVELVDAEQSDSAPSYGP